jgi:hypothetical protein
MTFQSKGGEEIKKKQITKHFPNKQGEELK